MRTVLRGRHLARCSCWGGGGGGAGLAEPLRGRRDRIAHMQVALDLRYAEATRGFETSLLH